VTDLAPIAGKLANFLRLLASDKDGEVVAAAHAMVRTLNSFGASIHDVAERVENFSNGGLNENEMREIYNAGIAYRHQAGRAKVAQPGVSKHAATAASTRHGDVLLSAQRSTQRAQ